MWLQFFAQNIHFAASLFTALVCLGICWLYFDAWSNKHSLKELVKWVGFAVLGLSFLSQATMIEQSVMGDSVFGHIIPGLTVALRLGAFALIIVGQLIDPLQAVPKNKGLDVSVGADTSEPSKNTDGKKDSSAPLNAGAAFVPAVSLGAKILLPVGAGAIAVLYWRRATNGLERHLKPVARAFAFLALSELVGLSRLFSNTDNPVLYTHVATYGWIWWLQLILQIVGMLILGLWTWGYLLQRYMSQLFMIFMGLIGVVFIIVSVGYTGLLLNGTRKDSLDNLTTAANVLHYALDSKRAETIAAADQLASSQDVYKALKAGDREQLKSLTSDFLQQKTLTSTLITDLNGQVLLRAQDTEQWGDSVSGDPLVKRVLLGLEQTTVVGVSDSGAPLLQLQSGVPVKESNGNVIGAVITGLNLDTAFVSGIKEKTGLHSSIYANDILSATTLVSSTDAARAVGVKFSRKDIADKILKNGSTHSDSLTLQNRKMLVALNPVKDVDNVSVGMLMVAQPESAILKKAGHSVEITFFMTVALLLVSIFPIIKISRGFVRQMD